MTPYVTQHAAQRWDERSPASSVAPETAWKTGQRTTGVAKRHGTDECRVHEPTQTVLLRRNYRIVTVLSVRELDQDAYRHVAPVFEESEATT